MVTILSIHCQMQHNYNFLSLFSQIASCSWTNAHILNIIGHNDTLVTLLIYRFCNLISSMCCKNLSENLSNTMYVCLVKLNLKNHIVHKNLLTIVNTQITNQLHPQQRVIIISDRNLDRIVSGWMARITPSWLLSMALEKVRTLASTYSILIPRAAPWLTCYRLPNLWSNNPQINNNCYKQPNSSYKILLLLCILNRHLLSCLVSYLVIRIFNVFLKL